MVLAASERSPPLLGEGDREAVERQRQGAEAESDPHCNCPLPGLRPYFPQRGKRRLMAAGLVGALALSACGKAAGPAPGQGGAGLPEAALDHFIGDEIGDPTTCVIIADRATRQVLYRYGQLFNCVRGLPACDRPGVMTAQNALALADSADGRGASCASSADGTRRVGWAEGRITSTRRDLIYSAVMEGERALPGREMMARLDEAFANAGM